MWTVSYNHIFCRFCPSTKLTTSSWKNLEPVRSISCHYSSQVWHEHCFPQTTDFLPRTSSLRPIQTIQPPYHLAAICLLCRWPSAIRVVARGTRTNVCVCDSQTVKGSQWTAGPSKSSTGSVTYLQLHRAYSGLLSFCSLKRLFCRKILKF